MSRSSDSSIGVARQARMDSRMGFTLVEIMFVALIIGLLASIALPSFVRARENSKSKACITNLRLIDSAKEQYILENNLAFPGSEVLSSDVIRLYLKGNRFPSCPAGGLYDIGALADVPTCSLGNVSLGYHCFPTR